MSDASSDSTPTSSETTPRSTAAVLGIIGAIAAIVVIALICVLFAGRSSGGSADDAMSDVRDNRIQAVYMTNDRVFFGDLEARDGDWLRLNKAFYLRRSAEQAKGAAAGSTDLVPMQQEIGGDGNLTINSKEVVLIQNLAADSDISRKIEDAR